MKPEQKFNSSSKVVKESVKEDEEDIDEFIKKHLEADKDKLQEDYLESSSEASTALSPRQTLLNALVKLADANENKTNDRELFIYDLEQILKVITFKECCILIFPCLEVFAVEQDYLKIELFR